MDELSEETKKQIKTNIDKEIKKRENEEKLKSELNMQEQHPNSCSKIKQWIKKKFKKC